MGTDDTERAGGGRQASPLMAVPIGNILLPW
jgi:hypothetical protein